MKEEARDFRLISTALGSEGRGRTRKEEEEKLSQGSVETIRQQLFHTLDLLRRSLKLQTCALLWLDASGEKLKLKELASDAANVAEEPINAKSGVFGALLRDGRPLVLDAPRPALLPYYVGPAEVAAFAGVPVLEGRTLRGVLIADRKQGAAFEPEEVDLCAGAAEQITRIVQSERVFQAVERSKHENERFARASAALNRALTLAEVYEAALEGARGVCDFDFAAIATYDGREGAHVVCRAVGQREHPPDLVRLHPDARGRGRDERHPARHPQCQLPEGAPGAALSGPVRARERPRRARVDLRPAAVQVIRHR
jgi:GAF domain-containing protein